MLSMRFKYLLVLELWLLDILVWKEMVSSVTMIDLQVWSSYYYNVRFRWNEGGE